MSIGHLQHLCNGFKSSLDDVFQVHCLRLGHSDRLGHWFRYDGFFPTLRETPHRMIAALRR